MNNNTQKLALIITVFFALNSFAMKRLRDDGINNSNKIDVSLLVNIYSPEQAQQGQQQIINLILSGNVDIESADENNETALMKIVQSGNEFITKLLIDRGANVNAVTKQKECVLYLAVYERNANPNIAKILLEAGADPFNLEVDSKFMPATFLGNLFQNDSIDQSWEEIYFNMMKKFNAGKLDDGQNPLIKLLNHDCTALHIVTIFENLDINTIDENGDSYLCAALAFPFIWPTEIMTLLDMGAKPCDKALELVDALKEDLENGEDLNGESDEWQLVFNRIKNHPSN